MARQTLSCAWYHSATCVQVYSNLGSLREGLDVCRNKIRRDLSSIQRGLYAGDFLQRFSWFLSKFFSNLLPLIIIIFTIFGMFRPPLRKFIKPFHFHWGSLHEVPYISPTTTASANQWKIVHIPPLEIRQWVIISHWENFDFLKISFFFLLKIPALKIENFTTLVWKFW